MVPDVNPSNSGLHTFFLDRDGVINEKMPEGSYVRNIDEFRLLPGVVKAIGRINRSGARVVVLSNQRGIARGLYTCDDVDAIHAHLQQILNKDGAHIDGFFYCPHDKNSCACRKPLPGLYEQAAAEFNDIRPDSSVMIGDSLSDIEFGRRLGMKTIWIAGNPLHRKPEWQTAEALSNGAYASLPDAIDALLPE